MQSGITESNIQIIQKKEGKGMRETKFRGDKLNPTLSLITLNVNRLNFPIKCRNYQNWFLKCKIPQYSVYKRYTFNMMTHRLKISGQKYIIWTVSIERLEGFY